LSASSCITSEVVPTLRFASVMVAPEILYGIHFPLALNSPELQEVTSMTAGVPPDIYIRTLLFISCVP
jgi:hypothetical protein